MVILVKPVTDDDEAGPIKRVSVLRFLQQLKRRSAQSIRFAGIGFGQDEHATGRFFGGKSLTSNFQSLVARSVVNDDDVQIGIG